MSTYHHPIRRKQRALSTLRNIGTALGWTVAVVIIMAVILVTTLLGIGLGIITKER